MTGVKDFKDVLNKYMNMLDCSGVELAKYTDISTSVISRYKSGDKIPKVNSEQLNKLVKGIVRLAKDKGLKDIREEKVLEDFKQHLDDINFDIFIDKFNLLIDTLNINVADMARHLGYDPSYLSKIRTGIRRPAYKIEFANLITRYILRNYNGKNEQDKILSLMDINVNKDSYNNEFAKWLCSDNKVNNNESDKINHFLQELDSFKLDDYIKIIHFDELKVPSIPILASKSKVYYGVDGRKQSELDFLKCVVLNKNSKEVFMCSDMPMEELTKDIEFSKKWMLGLAMMLKKGLHLNIIHNLDRPFNEMMIGLEGWIPIYMTGQVSPYYLKNYNDKVYAHMNYASRTYALTGECIVGNLNKGRYYLTSNKNDVNYYNEKMKLLFNKATPLMDIYNENYFSELQNFFEEDIKIKGDRKRILSSLPFHTLSEETLLSILKQNNVNSEDIEKICHLLEVEKKYINEIIKDNCLTDEIYLFEEKEFKENKILLCLDKSDVKEEIQYTYEMYLKHYHDTEKYLKNNKNYGLIINRKQVFSNIDIYINEKKYVVVSKKKNPKIHFIIKHEKLVNAISEFTPILIDEV